MCIELCRAIVDGNWWNLDNERNFHSKHSNRYIPNEWLYSKHYSKDSYYLIIHNIRLEIWAIAFGYRRRQIGRLHMPLEITKAITGKYVAINFPYLVYVQIAGETNRTTVVWLVKRYYGNESLRRGWRSACGPSGKRTFMLEYIDWERKI